MQARKSLRLIISRASAACRSRPLLVLPPPPCTIAVRPLLPPARLQALAACPSSCLTCDEATGDCLTCPARQGLDTSSSPRRCKACDDIKCVDCGADYTKCSLCAFKLYAYLAPNGTCQ